MNSGGCVFGWKLCPKDLSSVVSFGESVLLPRLSFHWEDFFSSLLTRYSGVYRGAHGFSARRLRRGWWLNPPLTRSQAFLILLPHTPLANPLHTCVHLLICCLEIAETLSNTKYSEMVVLRMSNFILKDGHFIIACYISDSQKRYRTSAPFDPIQRWILKRFI